MQFPFNFRPMKRYHVSVLVLGLLALFSTSNAEQPLAPATEASALPRKNLLGLIELPRQTLNFKPTRDDFTIGSVVLQVIQLEYPPSGSVRPASPGSVRINGVVPKNHILYLKQVGKNQFELPELKLEYSNESATGPVYLTIKAWFNEASNQGDVPFYENHADRYALLTYCTNEADDPTVLNARWGANRAVTLQEFRAKLAAPIVIKLNQKPLPTGPAYPMLNDYLKQLSEVDLRNLHQLARDRGEQYVLTINARDADHANVFASVNDGTQFYGHRIYHAARVDGKWQVESVDFGENSF
jgi:hypothetical protein